jgi:hypothetical protein
MKKTLTSIAAALVLSSLSAMTVAHAEDPSVQIRPTPQRVYMAPEDFREFSNTYLLQNGQKVSFERVMTRFYTTIDGGERVRLYPVSSTAFETASGARIEFRDEAETVAIANFEKLSPSTAMAANTTMTARR